MSRFWETEKPVVLDTGANVLRYYQKAGFLMVHKPDYEKDGQTFSGKGVGLNLEALRDSPQELEHLLQILEALR